MVLEETQFRHLQGCLMYIEISIYYLQGVEALRISMYLQMSSKIYLHLFV